MGDEFGVLETCLPDRIRGHRMAGTVTALIGAAMPGAEEYNPWFNAIGELFG